MSARVALGLVGVGQWGRHHARILSRLAGVHLVGLVDPDREKVGVLAERYGTKGFVDHRALLGRVEGVIIAVPTALHYEIARDFLEAGAHALVEKPITGHPDLARRLIDLAAERDRVLLVGHVERFKPAVQRLLALVREPLAIQARRVRPYDTHRTMDVGVILDLMIHDIDLVQAMAPGRFEDLRALGLGVSAAREDLAVAHLRTNTGCVVSLTASRIGAVKAAEVEVSMAEGAVHLDFLRQTLTVRERGGGVQHIVVESEETLRLELLHFVDCIRGHAEPLVTGEQAHRSLLVAQDLLDRLVQISPPLRV